VEENDYCVRVEAENTALRTEVEKLQVSYDRMEAFFMAERRIGDSLRQMVMDRDATIDTLRDQLRLIGDKAQADCA
jgi:hypothetical protein